MSRRNQITMSDDEVRHYLQHQLTVIVISNGANGHPHPMPMHFCLERSGAVAMTTYKKSQKVVNFQRDPRASLLLESGQDYAELRSVLIYAETEIIDDHAATSQCMIDCRLHSNGVKGVVSSADDDRKFAETAAIRAQKRLVLRFVPQTVISWDHGKLGGRY